MQLAAPSDLPPKSEEEQRGFFETVLEQARRAEAHAGLIEQDLVVAGTVVRLAFAGPSLKERLLPALAHLCVERRDKPDVVFHVWESEQSGVALPLCPCPTMCFTDRGDIWTMLSQSVRSAFHWSEHSLNLFDVDGRTGIFWVRSADELPYWTIASPLRTLFHWWMQENGAQLVHASAVGTDQGGLLITGKGGVGKSTTALACLKAGFRYAADDYVILTQNPDPVAHSLYCTAKVNVEDAGGFSEFDPQLLQTALGVGQKSVMFLHPEHRHSLALELPLKAVLTPGFAEGTESRVEPAGAALLKGAASFTTLCQLPHAGEKTVSFIDRLISSLPGYKLWLGSDVDGVPRTLRDLLGDLKESDSRPRSNEPKVAMPFVSVIIPVHNGAHFIADAVASLTAQDYPALEIIVIDDGSKDAIAEAVAALPIDVRFFSQPSSGPSGARNRGIREAAGDIIAFLDVDDLWPEGKLEICLEALREDPSLDVVHGHGQLMEYDEAARSWTYIDNAEKNFPYYLGAAVFRREIFERVGLLDEKLRFAEDSDWFLRAARSGARIRKLDLITLLVRRHEGNMTAGKTSAELNPLRLFKNIRDKERALARAAVQAGTLPEQSEGEAILKALRSIQPPGVGPAADAPAPRPAQR